jgi:hypothetical protein
MHMQIYEIMTPLEIFVYMSLCIFYFNKTIATETWSTGNFMLYSFIFIVMGLVTQEEDELFSMVSEWENGCF